MKKAYFLLIAALIVVVLAFTYAKSYLSRLESKDLGIKEGISRTQLMDSLRSTYESMARETNADLQLRYDSLVDESSALIYALESQLNLILYPELDPATASDVASESAEDDASSAEDSTDAITPIEYEVYLTYLEKTLDLPGDLTAYERKVAVSEIRKTLMKEYSMGKSEVVAILKKMRERPERKSESG